MTYLNKGCRCKSRCKKRKCDGRAVIISAILFENGVSEVVAAEGELLQKLIERNEHPYILIKVNRQIARMICCLRDFEEKIVWEIIKE